MEDRGPELLKVCITLLTFAIVANCLRCVTRVALVKSFGLDDWIMVFAAISFILFVTCAITGIHYGTGRHYDDLSTENFQEAMKYWWLCYIWYCITMITSKVSIGVFLLRITIHKVHRWLIYMVMLLSVVTGVVFFFVTIFQCNPVSFFWNRLPGGTCVDPQVIAGLTYLYSACSVICDFTFALLPIHMIHGLQMDRKTKIALVPILGMACVASVAVVVRFAYIKDFLNPDFLYATVDIAIWSTVEQGLAVTAGSLATLRPLFRLVMRVLGLQDTRSATPAPSKQLPTIGSAGKMKGSKGSKHTMGSFSLVTIDPGSGKEEGYANASDIEAQPPGNQIHVKKEVAVSTKRGSIWGMPGHRFNESEEELTDRISKEATQDGPQHTPKSFLSDENRGSGKEANY